MVIFPLKIVIFPLKMVIFPLKVVDLSIATLNYQRVINGYSWILIGNDGHVIVVYSCNISNKS